MWPFSWVWKIYYICVYIYIVKPKLHILSIFYVEMFFNNFFFLIAFLNHSIPQFCNLACGHTLAGGHKSDIYWLIFCTTHWQGFPVLSLSLLTQSRGFDLGCVQLQDFSAAPFCDLYLLSVDGIITSHDQANSGVIGKLGKNVLKSIHKYGN